MGSYSCCTKKGENKKIEKLSLLLKLVGEKNRLQILCILKKGKHCVCEVNKNINASQSLISHHLKDLKDGGLIKDNKKGLNVYYSLTFYGRYITDLINKIPQKEVSDK